MTIPITGAPSDQSGPAACVVRFILAGVAGDSAAALAQMHPDSRAAVAGQVSSPPGLTAAEIGEPEPQEDRVLVPTRLSGAGGSEQRFVFVVRPVDAAWGVDLEASMAATFGGDPAELMQEALRTAVAPLGEALDQVAATMGEAFGGHADGGPAARRIDAAAPLPEGVALPATVVAHPTELELRRRVLRSDGETEASTEVTVRVRFDLDPAWSVTACLGVVLDRAVSVEGEDLRPPDAGDELGAESYASWEQERRDFQVRLPLAAPGRAFTGLAELSGRAHLAVVGGELLEIALGPVGELVGRSVELPALGMALAVEREADGNVVLRAPYGWFDRLVELRMVDASGEAISESWSGSGDGEISTREYHCEIGDDAGIVLRFWAQTGTAVVGFSCEGLPLILG